MLAVHEAAEALLNCVCGALDALPTTILGLAGCPCRKGVVAGAPAADACGGDLCAPLGPGEWPGQLTVNVIRLFASDRTSFPRELGSTQQIGGGVRDLKNCAMPVTTAVELSVTLFRCAPGSTDQGCPPTMADLNETAMQYHADMLAVQQGILCCFSGTDTTTRRTGRRYTVGQTTTIGPQGGCVGFQTRVTVALDDVLPPIPAGP